MNEIVSAVVSKRPGLVIVDVDGGNSVDWQDDSMIIKTTKINILSIFMVTTI